MIKFLFLDNRGFERLNGFTRQLEPPRKCADQPLLVSDGPADGNVITMYGSVIRRGDGLWQLWYTCRPAKLGLALGYAQSRDGVEWERPRLDRVRLAGRKTNLVFSDEPHGATVFFDEREERPAWRYKLLCGAAPSHKICAYHSPDGQSWKGVTKNPVTGSNPDSPMSLHRAWDGRYVAYHRPNFGDRRVGRSESWDFLHWSEARLVMEPNPLDPPQTQFYGLGATPYGDFELGALWIYQTFADDMDFFKMRGHQQPELAYSRSGYAWHRAAQGQPWIARGTAGAWDWGMVQPASSAVLLAEEIRFYYAAFRVAHPWGRSDESIPQRCGLSYAACKPDRFVAQAAGKTPAELLTRPFWTDTPNFYVNAAIARAGSVQAEVLDLEGKVITGFAMDQSLPTTGDGTALPLRWQGDPDRSLLAHRQIRLRFQARQARLYSIFSGSDAAIAVYWRFRSPFYLDMDKEKAGW